MTDNEFRWYVVHTYSGYEKRVIESLDLRRSSLDQDGDIEEYIIPEETKTKIQGGKKVEVVSKILPSYILVKMRMNDASWAIVRNTSGVTGFVSGDDGPIPLSDEEYEEICRQMNADEPRIEVGFKEGESVRITDGPFAEFIGNVSDIDSEKGRVRVMLSLFGRETPVELDFMQVEKL
jgi:transcriptional antiterminator NusG